MSLRLPGFVWRMYEFIHKVPDIPPGRASVLERDTVGSDAKGASERSANMDLGSYPADWLGSPILVGSTVIYPCDAYASGQGRTTQMAVGTVSAVRENGISVNIGRRSRTGVPRGPRSRTTVHLTRVGMANVTVIG